MNLKRNQKTNREKVNVSDSILQPRDFESHTFTAQSLTLNDSQTPATKKQLSHAMKLPMLQTTFICKLG